jgi:hypothetical protein
LALIGSGSVAVLAQPYSGGIPDLDVRAIQAAMPHFTATGFRLEDYDLHVTEEADTVIVNFNNRNVPRGTRGCPREWRHYQVALQKDRTTVVQAGVVICR